tara:strand:+ start:6459 stop:6764 length:306 start_codon:yes stop_codon:yes gene_type:complete
MDIKKIGLVVAIAAGVVGIMTGYFNFAGWPPYPSVKSVEVADRKANTATQIAMQNRVDFIQRLVWQASDRVKDGKGGVDRLRELQKQLRDAEAALKRALKK